MLIPSKKPEIKSVRMSTATLEFLETKGPPSTVINLIIEKTIKNWDEFSKLPD